MTLMQTKAAREQQFTALAETYKEVIAKVCSVYVSPIASFDDLYQEVLINVWQGLDSFRGEAKVSSWIYRTAINTCLTWHRRNAKHRQDVGLDLISDIPVDDNSRTEQCRELYAMIATLEPLEKALVTLWLDEKSYAEISEITGLSKANVATRLHRIREKLIKKANS
ncbi:MAG: RNA polymerase sigma factor [Muribaculaceae bacterium]